MFICPLCHANLSREQNHLGVFWACASCEGRAVTIPILRKVLPREAVNALWQSARSESAPKCRDCPACLARMTEVSLSSADCATLTLDVCVRCQTVWFDTHEYEQIPEAPPPQSPSLSLQAYMRTLPPEARERIMMRELDILRERYELQGKKDQSPDAYWKYIPAIFGLPFVHSESESNRFPWITWGLAGVIVAVSLMAFHGGQDVPQRFGLVPATLLENYGLTLVSSVFLHGGFFHLLSNMYFLVVFGDNVEDLLGKARYALLLLLAMLAGGLAHVLANVNDTTPCVGASGVISGILAYYALAFPHARLGLMFWVWWRIKWVNLSARAMFLLWFALQLVGIWMQLKGFSNVSALAHVGGVAAGTLFWVTDKWRDRKNTGKYRHCP